LLQAPQGLLNQKTITTCETVIEGKLILGIVEPEYIMSVYVLWLRELPGDKQG
jgi:hypothetical protein